MRTRRRFAPPASLSERVRSGRACLLLWLLLSLCMAPWLARMHQVVHATPALVAQAAATAQAAANPAVHAGGVGGVQALFGHHASLDCQALDQLAHGQAPQPAFIWQPPTWGAAAPVAAVASAPPALRWWSPIARGPPRSFQQA